MRLIRDVYIVRCTSNASSLAPPRQAFIICDYPRGRLTAKTDLGVKAAGLKRAEGAPRRRRHHCRRAIREGGQLKHEPAAD